MATFSVEEECSACKGSGLYVGFAEKCGAAVVCHNCKGTGKYSFTHTYKEFVERKPPKTTIRRVYRVNPGVGIGEGPGKDGEVFTLESFGGISFEDWSNGKRFPKGSEMRKYTCPAWFYQSADYARKPEWKECGWGGTFSDCEHYSCKDKCWERFDQEKL